VCPEPQSDDEVVKEPTKRKEEGGVAEGKAGSFGDWRRGGSAEKKGKIRLKEKKKIKQQKIP